MLHDRNFDDLCDLFARNIYASAKGEIRLAVIWQHLLDSLPQLNAGKRLRILDAGCGLGQTGLLLAKLGHQLVMADPSERMLEQARAMFAAEVPDADVQFIHAPVQRLLELEGCDKPFDLVLFHAVLEWLAEPETTLKAMTPLLRVGGHLSLMFYNRDALVFRNLIRGNWNKLESGSLQGDPGGLTPMHPLPLGQVEQWLLQMEMQVLSRAGVRVIYDYMDRKMRDKRSVEAWVNIEMKYARSEPYLQMGRYLHLIAERA